LGPTHAKFTVVGVTPGVAGQDAFVTTFTALVATGFGVGAAPAPFAAIARSKDALAPVTIAAVRLRERLIFFIRSPYPEPQVRKMRAGLKHVSEHTEIQKVGKSGILNDK
jgi:hypothetical protein